MKKCLACDVNIVERADLNLPGKELPGPQDSICFECQRRAAIWAAVQSSFFDSERWKECEDVQVGDVYKRGTLEMRVELINDETVRWRNSKNTMHYSIYEQFVATLFAGQWERQRGENKSIGCIRTQVSEGAVHKGGQNPPNTGDRRPPPPSGSGVKPPAFKVNNQWDIGGGVKLKIEKIGDDGSMQVVRTMNSSVVARHIWYANQLQSELLRFGVAVENTDVAYDFKAGDEWRNMARSDEKIRITSVKDKMIYYVVDKLYALTPENMSRLLEGWRKEPAKPHNFHVNEVWDNAQGTQIRIAKAGADGWIHYEQFHLGVREQTGVLSPEQYDAPENNQLLCAVKAFMHACASRPITAGDVEKLKAAVAREESQTKQ